MTNELETQPASAAPGEGETPARGKAPRRLALRPLHQSLGAVWSEDLGVELPAHYGDPAGERRALREGVALWDASGCDRLELLGRDRHRFLNGMVTADIARLEPGRSCHGLFTNLKGRVLADAAFLAFADRLWARLPASTGAAIRAHLGKFVITDDVEILPLADMLPIVLAGPEAEAVLDRGLGAADLPAAGEHRRVTLAGTEVELAREDRFGVPAFSLWISASLARGFVPALLETSPAPLPVGLEAVESVRIAAGIPRFGRELGPETFPQEAGADDAVSYEKGCYLGQEVVARIHFRGGVQRHLVHLELAAGAVASPGDSVSFEEREAGQVTSVVPPSPDGPRLALAILARRAADPGTVVALAGGGEATVRALPDRAG